MKRAVIAASIVCVLVGTAAAQHADMHKPGPEHKKLAYFVGNWTSVGEMKASPFGPGGKFTSTEKSDWLPGGFFVVIHSTAKTPMGPMHELAVMGYNAEDKVYTYDAYDNMGEHEVSKGAVVGNTWTWQSEQKVEGKTMKSRFTMNIVSPGAYNYKYEISTGGTNWTSVMEGKATKVK